MKQKNLKLLKRLCRQSIDCGKYFLRIDAVTVASGLALRLVVLSYCSGW